MIHPSDENETKRNNGRQEVDYAVLLNANGTSVGIRAKRGQQERYYQPTEQRSRSHTNRPNHNSPEQQRRHSSKPPNALNGNILL